MPTLELIHERFARTARLTLYNMVRRPIELEVRLPELKPYQVFVNAFPERTNINLVNIRPFFPVHLDADKITIHNFSHRLILK